jgi:ketosteroid isomerase-like protein
MTFVVIATRLQERRSVRRQSTSTHRSANLLAAIEGGPVSESDFDNAVEAFRQAQGAFVKGNARPAVELFSHSDDATLANPFGPPHRGWEQIAKASEEAAANFKGGSLRFEEVSRYATPDLGYILELERIEAQVAGSEDITPMSLRATMIFRREEDGWKVVHRHADAITTRRDLNAIVEQPSD